MLKLESKKMASGSGSGDGSQRTIEARLTLIQTELENLRRITGQQEEKQCRLHKIGNDRRNMLNQELKEIREEIWEDHMTNMKDIAVSSGELGKRLIALEKKVEDLCKALGKTPKAEA